MRDGNMNNGIRPEQMYKVGDIVKVKDSPVNCVFIWVDSMTKYCGQTATILSARYMERKGAWGYEIDLDKRWCIWCDNCFEPIIPDLPEFSTEASDLTSLFS